MDYHLSDCHLSGCHVSDCHVWDCHVSPFASFFILERYHRCFAETSGLYRSTFFTWRFGISLSLEYISFIFGESKCGGYCGGAVDDCQHCRVPQWQVRGQVNADSKFASGSVRVSVNYLEGGGGVRQHLSAGCMIDLSTSGENLAWQCLRRTALLLSLVSICRPSGYESCLIWFTFLWRFLGPLQYPIKISSRKFNSWFHIPPQ